jgi:hypothetical protein
MDQAMKVDLAVKRLAYILEVLVSNLSRDAIMNEGFRGFPQSLRENVGIIPRLDQDSFLPNPLPFTSVFKKFDAV